jgi:hypothetical protein
MATIKMKALDKFVRARKAVKAARATEQGIAGHQAAMNALGNAGGWERVGSRSLLSAQGNGPVKRAITPGFGHVVVNKERLGYEGIDPQEKGNK